MQINHLCQYMNVWVQERVGEGVGVLYKQYTQMGSIAGLSSSQPTILTEGNGPATWEFPLVRARGHTVMSVREMFEL